MSTVVQATPTRSIAIPPMPKAEPCTIVIFGASGDLTKRKLIPALYDLACIGCISGQQFDVLGTGRTEMTTDEFRKAMRDAASTSKDARKFSDWNWEEFEKRLHYFPGDINNDGFYHALKDQLSEIEKNGGSSNHLFYVSTQASLAPPIVQGLGKCGLSKNEKGWTRIVLEKPFGRDLESAKALNREVLQVFDEKDVYRIDHYLGKETVQNILVFRFGNSLFEPIWNRNYINSVEITAAETLGVEQRAAFYEETGALRDMVANHLLQLVTLTAMEPPVAFDADSVREQKVQVLRAIHHMTPEQVCERTVRGQYGPGKINGKDVPGYREEPGVKPDSRTETYVAVEFRIDNWRWAGVPFYVRSGKRLAKSETEIKIHFKRTPQALFAKTSDDDIEANVITLRVQPNEGITMSFAAKQPGAQMKAVPVKMDFSYQTAFGGQAPVAYETLLLDAMRGDPTLFTRGDEAENQWRIITPIEDAWLQLPVPKFPNYAAGSDGPEEANTLIAEECKKWSPIG
ncbi:glucose-6-phosphate 1-dehydrogenase [Candidatus Koribacter versatilis Ellin345]|uniref:Glucose-6-phosphate 1-dehydrogenase n=1 Tax=Koribacter versatilis (strain Ellin345) TaxID=204669 RepID=Q1IMT7_KORVE|nr:glucose-6-phosphate dehydrogenase [Candidatus Koribacter versatilis]ABF41813.1 glucose-6-phosphate 1-dehydrogenase [Candidatus Koribacter versatilis Ellin345]